MNNFWWDKGHVCYLKDYYHIQLAHSKKDGVLWFCNNKPHKSKNELAKDYKKKLSL